MAPFIPEYVTVMDSVNYAQTQETSVRQVRVLSRLTTEHVAIKTFRMVRSVPEEAALARAEPVKRAPAPERAPGIPVE